MESGSESRGERRELPEMMADVLTAVMAEEVEIEARHGARHDLQPDRRGNGGAGDDGGFGEIVGAGRVGGVVG